MTTTLYIPATTETDPQKQNRSLAVIGGQTATNTDNITSNTAAIATLNAATYVNSIAGNNGAFTLNSTSGITNSTNDIKLQQGSSSQFGAVKVDNTTITAASGVISTVNPLPAPIHASLGADVALNNTANYFDGPSIAQGTTGTWFVSGTVTMADTAGAGQFYAKLWDGTTVIASGSMASLNSSNAAVIALSGYIVTPAANLKISCRQPNATTGNIKFNFTGNSKDSTISAFRIA